MSDTEKQEMIEAAEEVTLSITASTDCFPALLKRLEEINGIKYATDIDMVRKGLWRLNIRTEGKFFNALSDKFFRL